MAKSKTVKSADKHDTKSAERALRKEKRSKIDGVKKHKGDKSDRKKAEVSKDVVLTEKPTQADEQMQKALALNVKRIRAMFSDKHYRLPFANPLVTEREEIILLKVLLAGLPTLQQPFSILLVLTIFRRPVEARGSWCQGGNQSH